jgi:hypothetical protein
VADPFSGKVPDFFYFSFVCSRETVCLGEEVGNSRSAQLLNFKICRNITWKFQLLMAEEASKRADFNSWIIGGQYTKNSFKRQAGAPAKVELDENHKQQLEARKLKLKEEREKFCAEYKPKVASAFREKRETAAAGHRADAPPRTASPPNPNKPAVADDSLALRNRLRDSFAQITATHAYGTLFPPLLTPYNRPCLVNHNPDRPKSPVKDLTDQTPEKVLPTQTENSLSVTKNERRRVQPVSGPKAFFPTGSTTSAYRHFCHPA